MLRICDNEIVAKHSPLHKIGNDQTRRMPRPGSPWLRHSVASFTVAATAVEQKSFAKMCILFYSVIAYLILGS